MATRWVYRKSDGLWQVGDGSTPEKIHTEPALYGEVEIIQDYAPNPRLERADPTELTKIRPATGIEIAAYDADMRRAKMQADAPDAKWRVSKTTVTAVQLRTLRAAPVELVEAPGASYLVQFMGAALLFDGSTPAFTVTDPDDLVIRYTDGTGPIASELVETTGVLTVLGARIVNAVPAANARLMPNAPLVLHNAGLLEFGGLGGGSLKVRVFYVVHSQ